MQASELSFPEQLVIERKRLGLTQDAFADMLGISRPTVARWEAGGPVRFEILAAVALDSSRPDDVKALALRLYNAYKSDVQPASEPAPASE